MNLESETRFPFFHLYEISKTSHAVEISWKQILIWFRAISKRNNTRSKKMMQSCPAAAVGTPQRAHSERVTESMPVTLALISGHLHHGIHHWNSTTVFFNLRNAFICSISVWSFYRFSVFLPNFPTVKLLSILFTSSYTVTFLSSPELTFLLHLSSVWESSDPCCYGKVRL